MGPPGGDPRSKKSASPYAREVRRLSRELGVSPRRLGGWEPREVIDVERDERGRVSRLVVSREAEWDDSQVAALLASREEELDRGAHGIPMSVATDPTTRGRVIVERITDFVDEALERERESDRIKYKDPSQRRGIIYAPRIRE